MLVRRLCLLLFVFLFEEPLIQSAVVAVDHVQVQDLAGNRDFRFISAKVHFAIDPRLEPNRAIADIDLAPHNRAGLVEFSADLQMVSPRSKTASNGTALVEISNRGGKSLFHEFNLAQTTFHPESPEAVGDQFLLKHGFTLVWIGWEFDVPEKPEVIRADFPIATEAGRTIEGIVRAEWTGEKRLDTIPLGDKAQVGYSVLDANAAENRMYVRNAVDAARSVVPRDQWRFADAKHVSLTGGFQPGLIYEVVYRTSNPPVAGLGLAAVRDFVSYLKYGGTRTELEQDRSLIQRTIGFGVSQSGRFLREFLYDGFNEDEQGRKAFDGVWAHVAGAGRGSFNHRFAQPSRDGQEFVNVFYPVDVPPFDEEALLEKAHHDHVVPKLFLTNGASEYWSRCASLIHTTTNGKADEPPLATTRVYFFSGSQHVTGAIPPRAAPGQNLANTNDYRYALRALLLDMQEWLTKNTAPPESVFPQVKKKELTEIAGLHFPSIGGITVPPRKREAYRLDFATEPPKSSAPFPTFVPQVDGDGNDQGGIRMPAIAVPLGTYSGWNLRQPETGAPGDLIPFTGSYIPFARTKEERVAKKDARLSAAERYPNEEGYLQHIDQAARQLTAKRLLLEEDLPLLHQRAEREWAFWTSLENKAVGASGR